MAMRKTTSGALLFAVLISACGGEGDVVPPPQAPPPPPPAAPAPPPVATTPPPAPEPPKPPLIDLQKQGEAAAVAALNAHDAKKMAELYATDTTVTVVGMGEPLKGREAVQADFQKLFDGFPDSKFALTRVFVKGDVLIHEWVSTGTNKAEFMGMKATNKAIGIRGAAVLWFNPDGTVKQEHRYFDGATMMSQLGQMKTPSRKPEALPSGEASWHVAKGTPEEDKQLALAKTIYDSFEKKSESDFLGNMDDKITWSDVSQPKDMTGKAAAKQFFGMYTKAFTDIKQTIDPFFAVDEFVVSESAMTGVHSGQLGPLKPTKKPVTLHGIDIMTVKDGKVVSGISYANSMELLAQEGLLPKPKAKPEDKKEGDKKAAGEKKEGDKKEGDKKEGDKKPEKKEGDKKAEGDKKPAEKKAEEKK
jgi:steroid delta-isomerase-like uncharacterized protein